MLTIYCMECAQPTQYTLQKPKFCASCGQPFETYRAGGASPTHGVSASSQKKPQPAPQPIQEEEVEAQQEEIRKPSWMNRPRPQRKVTANKRVQQVEEDDDGDEEIIDVPQIESLDVKIEGLERQRETLRDVIGTMSPEEAKGIRRPKEKVSRAAVMKEFKKEAGTLRHD